MQEFENALCERDTLIEQLTISLEQALSARNALTGQLNALNTLQLDNPNMNLQQKVNPTHFMLFIITNNNFIRIVNNYKCFRLKHWKQQWTIKKR